MPGLVDACEGQAVVLPRLAVRLIAVVVVGIVVVGYGEGCVSCFGERRRVGPLQRQGDGFAADPVADEVLFP